MPTKTSRWAFTLAALSAAAWQALAAPAEDAALDLQPETPATQRAPQDGAGKLRMSAEVAFGRLGQRYGLGSEDTRRATFDLAWEAKLGSSWRAGISNRTDDIHPPESGFSSTINSLRELYVGWQGEDGRTLLDAGRLNVRHGPAYGFNPTDYFREGVLRAITSPDPLAQRENRLGTGMLRWQQLWDGGSVSLTLAPKLADEPSRASFGADLGSTNHSNRVLLTLSQRAGHAANWQLLAFHDQHRGTQLGASGTVLLGDSTVAFGEWSGGRDDDMLASALQNTPRRITAHRATLGLTYSLPSRLSLTAEFEYNGFAATHRQWDQAVAQVGLLQLEPYLLTVQRRQDIASRRALLLYVSQRDMGIKNLDLTALARINLEDHSRFGWIECRYRWSRADVALQWQYSAGGATSEFGSSTARTLTQVVATVYF